MMNRTTLGVGERAVLIYAFVTYVPQFFLHVSYEESFVERFKITEGAQILAIFIPLFFIVVFLLHALIPRVQFNGRSLSGMCRRIFESKLNIPFGVLLVALAISFSIKEGVTFRQSGDLLNQAGMDVGILIFSKSYIYAWLVYFYLVTAKTPFDPPRLLLFRRLFT